MKQEDVDRMIAVIQQYIPKFKIIPKKESWLQRAIGWLLTPVNPEYMSNYITVMFGKMYIPEHYDQYTPAQVCSILRHEFVHLMDAKLYGLLFTLSYLFFLPAVWTFRAFWELRAYTQTMLFEYENTGRIEESTKEFIVGQFVGSQYVWMCPFRDTIERKVEELAIQIQKGEITGFYPHQDFISVTLKL